MTVTEYYTWLTILLSYFARGYQHVFLLNSSYVTWITVTSTFQIVCGNVAKLEFANELYYNKLAYA